MPFQTVVSDGLSLHFPGVTLGSLAYRPLGVTYRDQCACHLLIVKSDGLVCRAVGVMHHYQFSCHALGVLYRIRVAFHWSTVASSVPFAPAAQ